MTTHFLLLATRRMLLKRMIGIAVCGAHTQSAYAAARTSAQVRGGEIDYPTVVEGTALLFPRDHGAHPDYRTEWWYLTAWLQSNSGPLGLQLTFFRSRTPYARNNPSRFAPRQLIFAHAALADPARGSLLHAEQAWRADPVTASYSEFDTALAVGPPSRRWSLSRERDDRYHARIDDSAFSCDIDVVANSAPVLQGRAGFSRKGPELTQASYYYSRPQLAISGSIQREGHLTEVTGTGWLDHEWSSELLDPRAAGWDWIGLNFDNGDALMAFRMRARDGTVLYSTARLIRSKDSSASQTNNNNNNNNNNIHDRIADDCTEDLPVTFTELRHWQSPSTGARYPVAMRVRAGELDLTLEPLFNNQELDSRGSTGIIYWEGAVRAWFSKDIASLDKTARKPIAKGYLELTGYAGDVTF
jgi:predicted secreted hydrolase